MRPTSPKRRCAAPRQRKPRPRLDVLVCLAEGLEIRLPELLDFALPA